MNPRIFNDQLCHVLRRTEEQHVEQSDVRRSGRTFRNVLRAVLWASATDNKRMLYATYSPEAAHHAFRMACDITAGIAGRQANASNRSIILPNQSIIEFRSSRDAGYDVGKAYFGIVKDAE